MAKLKLNEEITGLDVARMVGCEDIYLRNKDAEDIAARKRVEFQESFKRVCDRLDKTKKNSPFKL